MIRVFIIAPSIAVRAGLRALLSEEADIDVVGEAGSPFNRESNETPDVIIWSPSAPLAQELTITEAVSLASKWTAALLVIYADGKLIDKLTRMSLRAWGLLPEELSQLELVSSVRALNEGLVVVHPVWMRSLASNRAMGNGDDGSVVEPLTSREIELLQLLALGLTNKQIAVQLGISTHTVKFHLSSIFSKMGTTNRTETVKLGLQMGYILL